MRVIDNIATLREIVRRERCAGKTIGLVPTMGYLHQGHLRLIDEGRKGNDVLVTSIYVNPTQFGPQEDLDRYPRDLERDGELARTHGVDILFVPGSETMYPCGADGQLIWVDPGPLATHLCGPSRPGHFRGVATVVVKLFNIVQPDRAYFGQKDGQQAVLVERMARDLAFPVEVCIVPTVRDETGLALSSRNIFLSAEERAQAVALSRSLDVARSAIEGGERDADRIEAQMRRFVSDAAPLAQIDYITVADLQTMQPVNGTIEGDVLIALALYFGSTRLIDNMIVRSGNSVPSFEK